MNTPAQSTPSIYNDCPLCGARTQGDGCSKGHPPFNIQTALTQLRRYRDVENRCDRLSEQRRRDTAEVRKASSYRFWFPLGGVGIALIVVGFAVGYVGLPLVGVALIVLAAGGIFAGDAIRGKRIRRAEAESPHTQPLTELERRRFELGMEWMEANYFWTGQTVYTPSLTIKKLQAAHMKSVETGLPIRKCF